MIRPMRGQIVIREEIPQGRIWVPEGGPRDRKTHVGRVIACGPPARTPSGAEVERGFNVGDLVQFHWTHLEEASTFIWQDGKKACWIPQQNVDGVWDA